MYQNKLRQIALMVLLLVPSLADAVRVYVIFSPSHENFFKEWFEPTLPRDFELIIERKDQCCKVGAYNTPGWQNMMLAKVDLVIRAIKENWGGYFVHSDVDIQFFGEIASDIDEQIVGCDMVIQRDAPPRKVYPFGIPCAGFFVCRGNERTLRLWTEVRAYMLKHKKHDQRSLLDLLIKRNHILQVNWRYLPNRYMSGGTYTGHGWKENEPFPIAEDIVLHHGNWAQGVSKKVEQMKMVRKAVKSRKRGTPVKGIIWKAPNAAPTMQPVHKFAVKS